MKLVSLCSGYGGLDLAVEAVTGAHAVAYAEIEDAPARVFTRHWPDARALGDLTAVDWTTVEADVVCAGFPCQDLSYAGKGRGIVADSRSGLWYAIEHALGVLRPRLVVLENVSAIVARRPGLDVVLAGLASLGMSAQWACVRASDLGIPHRRDRWFLVAHTADASLDGRPEGRAGTGQRSGSGGQPAGHRDAASDAEGDTGRLVHGDAAALTHTDGGRRRHRREPDSGPDRPGLEAPRRDDADGLVTWGDYGPAIARWAAVLGRDAPRPTNHRGRLSPAFVEWMMGLPAGWVTDTPGLSRSQQLKCLGNGVVPFQASYAISMHLERAALTEATA